MKMSKRKRSKPSYLNDFCDQDTDDADLVGISPQPQPTMKSLETKASLKSNQSKIIPNQTIVEVKSDNDKCCICEETMSSKINIENSTGSSEMSYAEVMNNLFSSNSLEVTPKLSFKTGNICVFCKVPIQDLDLLQHKVKGLIKVILTRLATKMRRLENNVSEEKVDVTPKTKVIKKIPLKRKRVEGNQRSDVEFFQRYWRAVHRTWHHQQEF